MNTPITDAVTSADHLIDTARRLELDRAALMEALATAERHLEPVENTSPTDDRLCDANDAAWMVLCDIRAALTAARANFPES